MSISQFSPRRAATALLSSVFAAAAMAAPPAAPELAFVGAPKQVRFDWDPVPQANYYELWFKADADTDWAKVGERPGWRPHWDANVSSHLLNWFDSRWDVRACNSSGCSAPREIDIGSTVVNTVGYVKPRRPVAAAAFGSALDVSENGKTLVAVASSEPRSGTSGPGTATVHVFRANNGRWAQEARLRPSNAQPENGRAVTASLSRDGNVLAVGIPDEHCCPGGHGADRPHGAVYLFRRNGTGWREEARLANDDRRTAHLGAYVKLSDDGKKLATVRDLDGGRRELALWRYENRAWRRDGGLRTVAGDQVDIAMSGNGGTVVTRVRQGQNVIFRIHTGRELTLADTFQNVLIPTDEVSGFDVSGDGNAFVTGAIPKDVSADQYDPDAWRPTVTVYERSGTEFRLGTQLFVSRLQPTDYARRSLFGQTVALSHTAAYVAVNDPHDARCAHGVQAPPDTAYGASGPCGAIYMYGRDPELRYRLRRHIGTDDFDTPVPATAFEAMDFGNDGRTFATGEPGNSSAVGGIRGAAEPPFDDSSPGAGAVWLY